MFIPRSVPSSAATTTTKRPVPVAAIAIVLTTLLLSLVMLGIFFWRSRRADRADAEAHPNPAEKKQNSPPAPPRTAMRPLELSQLPRAYTPFSSLPPRWSLRHANPNVSAPNVYTDADGRAILPLYSARPAPAPVRPAPPRRYSSRGGRRERGRDQGYEQLDRDNQDRERVLGKLNGLMSKMRVEFKETL